MKKQSNSLSRRRFLNLSGKGVAAASLYSTLGSFQLAHAASGDDYKALVCIFLLGGNDSYNMFVPRDASRYQQYSAALQNLAIPQDQLLAVEDATLGEFGFHPNCTGLQSLYDSGNLAVMANTGVLKAPTTREDFLAGADMPKHLFSHNSQQAAWMSANPDLVSSTGWAGRMADMLTPSFNAGADLAMNVSLGGTNLWQTGGSTVQYNLSSFGVNRMPVCREGSGCFDVMQGLMDQGLNGSHLMEQGHARIRNRAGAISELLDSQLPAAFAPNLDDFPTTDFSYPGNTNVAQQLQMVTRMPCNRIDRYFL